MKKYNINKFDQFLIESKMEELSNLYSNKIDDLEISTLKILSKNSSSNFNWLLKNYTKDRLNYRKNISGINTLLDLLDDYFTRYLGIKKIYL